MGKGPIKVRDGLRQIAEKEARRPKKKVIVGSDSEEDIDEEMRGFGFGAEDMAAVPDPWDTNANYLPL
jgi:hypothetical protein